MSSYIGIAVLSVVVVVESRAITTELPLLCNVTLQSQSTDCPVSHCCVHDEFLFSYTHCEPYGLEHQPCSIKPSSFECQCTHGLTCVSNIHATHDSLFGTCQRSVNTTVSTAANVTPTTPASTPPSEHTKSTEIPPVPIG